MKAMVLAAGLGTRLRPLTNDKPKALVTIGGRTLLEITLKRLRSFGVDEVIVNVHHFADQIIDCIARNENFGMRIEVSREEVLLDTGGGLKNAGWFFLEGGRTNEPFLLHNVDIISNIDLKTLVNAHVEHGALATLAVNERESSRQLIFDDDMQLCGRRNGSQRPELVRECCVERSFGFCGIHVISPRIFTMLTGDGPFPIIDSYLRFVSAGERIVGFDAGTAYWRDLGKPESLADAEEDIASGKI